VSRLATRHFQKFTPLPGGNDGLKKKSKTAGTMDFKKIENLEFLK
jgi:hypothetical protein